MKKTAAVLKRAMTEKRERWQGKECYGRTKPRLQQSVGSDGGQSSHDAWDISQPQGKWREISAKMDAVGIAVKEKSSTWNKSCREGVEREAELYKMIEAAVMDEKTRSKRKRNDQRLA